MEILTWMTNRFRKLEDEIRFNCRIRFLVPINFTRQHRLQISYRFIYNGINFLSTTILRMHLPSSSLVYVKYPVVCLFIGHQRHLIVNAMENATTVGKSYRHKG